ncbi:antibiotic biosynthesis monooxygenase [Halomicroarcula sp. F13]|uniref:Antibiotic biosynthesis monooxygenase n=1 Tax=Haloarcula rubra TaxID=2487747 RepID=A0AAW4PUB1_9EURY|nr:antibiotic biosynthesis monooxygenase [Halomicroarcula rubra]MBX0323968.1 antibiotic biosynthesis monooxygenase [Halomicroarcula rubra]
MLVVANHLPVAPEHEADFVELFEERVAQLGGRSGLEKVEILRQREGNQFVVQAYWESRDAFEQWRDSDDFVAAHADLPSEMFTGQNRLEIYDLAAVFEPDA